MSRVGHRGLSDRVAVLPSDVAIARMKSERIEQTLAESEAQLKKDVAYACELRQRASAKQQSEKAQAQQRALRAQAARAFAEQKEQKELEEEQNCRASFLRQLAEAETERKNAARRQAQAL